MPLPVHKTTPVPRELLRDAVYKRLYDSILDGTLEPGESLLDDKLTAWLGVSRTPIREALMSLANLGLVEMMPNRYTRVAPLDFRAIDEALYVTGLLHEYAARISVPCLDNAAIERIKEAHTEIIESSENNNLPQLGKALNKLMLEFEFGTKNSISITISEGLSPQLLRYISVWKLPFNTHDLVGKVTEIVEAAIVEKDAEKTSKLIHVLYRPVYEQFIAEYRRTNSQIDESPIA